MIILRIWRGLYASREVTPFFTGIRRNEGIDVLWRIGGAITLMLLMVVLGFSLFYAALYNTLLGYLMLNRSRTLIHRLKQLNVYDSVATTSLGAVGVWRECIWASFFGWLILVWLGFLWITLIVAVGDALQSLFLMSSPTDALFALPLILFILLIAVDLFLSVPLGCLVMLAAASFGLTGMTRFMGEIGFIVFRLMSYFFLFPNDLIQVGGVTGNELVSALLNALLYIALMLGAHELLWYALGQRVGDDRNAIGSVLR